MPDYISQNLTSIIIAIIGVLAAGVAITIRYIKNSNKNSNNDSSNKVTQENSQVGGDQVGRDKIGGDRAGRDIKKR